MYVNAATDTSLSWENELLKLKGTDNISKSFGIKEANSTQTTEFDSFSWSIKLINIFIFFKSSTFLDFIGECVNIIIKTGAKGWMVRNREEDSKVWGNEKWKPINEV